MYSRVLLMIKTREEAAKALGLIDLLVNSLYKTDEGAFEKIVLDLPRSSLTGEIVNPVAQMGEAGERGKWLEGLRESIKGMGEMQVTLAVEPDNEIFEWLKKAAGEKNLVTVEVDPGIGGGMKVSFGGKYRDLTLAAKIRQVWQSEGAEISKSAGLLS